MKIWIICDYSYLPSYGPLTRWYYFDKYLSRAGENPMVFSGSHPHATNIQFITGHKYYKICEDCTFPWVFVKTLNYGENKIKRVLSMFVFYINMMRTSKQFTIPDVIIGSSSHPLCAVAAIILSKKFGCKAIVEIRDLWPESIVAYGIRKKSDPVIQLLYKLEKWIYTTANEIIFTMEGGRDYIIEKCWDKQTHNGSVDLDKVHHINNGVDLEVFDYNREHNTFADPDLDDPDTFKAVYCGAVRKVNKLSLLVDTARELQNRGNTNIKIFVYGDGSKLDELKDLSADVDTIVFKEKIEKKYIPYVLSKSDLCLMHGQQSSVLRYGMSLNKSFEYMASGKPILVNFEPKYDYIAANGCGKAEDLHDSLKYADAILSFSEMPSEEYERYCLNARKTAGEYDFKVLTEKLVGVIDHD